MIEVFRKELNGFLDSFIGYIVTGVFLIGMGMLMWVFPATSILDYGYADMNTLFSLAPYAFLFLIPAITMKSFAEEKKLGTLEFLFTKPLTEWSILGGKFLASYVLVMMSLVPTLVYYFSVYALGDPVGNVDTAGTVGSYIALMLLAGVFCSVGMWASSLVSGQISAFVVAGFMCLVWYSGFDALASLLSRGSPALFVKQLGILYHYDAMSRGVVDSRDVVYFMSIIGLMLLFTKVSLNFRR